MCPHKDSKRLIKLITLNDVYLKMKKKTIGEYKKQQKSMANRNKIPKQMF